MSVATAKEQNHKNEKVHEDAFRALIKIYGLMGRIMQPYFARFGISGSQWAVLRTIHRAHAEGLQALRLTDLSDRLLIRPPSVTGVVDRLQRMGLVSRGPSSKDLRAKEVRLTPTGSELVARILEGHSGKIAALMDGLELPQQTQFTHLLERLASHLGKLADGESTAE